MRYSRTLPWFTLIIFALLGILVGASYLDTHNIEYRIEERPCLDYNGHIIKDSVCYKEYRPNTWKDYNFIFVIMFVFLIAMGVPETIIRTSNN